jgi:uncharacterized protein (TIGR00369 family)
MSGDDHFRKLERMYASGPINEFYRPVIRVERGRAEVVVCARRDFFHAAGAVHGSVYFKSLDDAAFFAANSVVEDVFVLTASFAVRLLAPVSEGELRAVGRVVEEGRRKIRAESELFDARGEVLARGEGTFVKSRIPLTPEIGYA